ncbi:YycH family protein [Liquorilactobacillus aquaticus DSM 21051]|uniref:YycH family protein n=1 Tax=Liquorilactobacillus aquaticus DSM 21051 TaxID=1423725 RepID=A0A0R2CYS7_9LACO|nr:two-component system activity regulator YycH [Liquorilactobacillus aquaticus]KRM97005.1 YycH family protein [Liquorilactobacillus aquaticus DSM 21051]
MKIRNFLLHFGLTVTVILSVVLTTIILTNPATFQRDSKTTTSPGENDTATTSTKTISDVFVPVQTILNQDREQFQLYSSKTNLVNSLRKEIRKWGAGKNVTKTTFKNEEEYVAFLEQKNAVVLNYSDYVTIKLFNQTFSQKIEKHQGEKYNRILIPLNQKKVIYLMNDQTRGVYKVSFSKKNVKKIRTLLKNNEIKRLQMEYYLLGGHLAIFYLNSVQVPQYSYLINKANASSFVTQLLDSNGGDSISTKMQKNKVIYSDGADNRMTVMDSTSQIKYANYSNSDYSNNTIERRQSLNDHLRKSFAKLNSIGASLDDVYYSEYDQSNSMTIYRSYVSGFPIIDKHNYGAFKIQTMNSGGLKYDFSLLSLQVPVPSGGKNVTLPSTTDVYQNLINAGYSASKLKNIQIGYSWRENDASSLVIDLVPTYFVNYAGKWTDYNELLN